MRRLCLLLGSLLAACASRSDASPRPRFDPPYRVDPSHPGEGLVRQDLDPLLETARLARAASHGTLVGIGRVGFARDASYAVRVPYPSFVEGVRVAVDAHVARGTVLLSLRSAEVARLRSEVRSAQVSAATERANAARVERLVADGTASERERTEARARLLAAEGQLAGLQSALSAAGIDAQGGDRYALRAPSTGRVLARNVEPGERVAPDDAEPALLVGDPDRLMVQASFPERDAPWLNDAHACSFTVAALSGARFEGTLTELRRAVDPRTRSVVVTCSPAHADPRLSAEMAARVEVTVESPDAITIPRSALLLRHDAYVVFVRTAPGRVQRRPVEPGARLGEGVQVVSGLSAGDEVVVHGALLLDGELDQVL
ncbi:MAG: efflux RND transporter periplasmic adaptor subunit [Polyangiales bacterium]